MRRVVAAFGVTSWPHVQGVKNRWIGRSGAFQVSWEIDSVTHELVHYSVSTIEERERCAPLIGDPQIGVMLGESSWYVFDGGSETSLLIARALARLGIESEQAQKLIDCHLSAHERLEARLGMPREFWLPEWS